MGVFKNKFKPTKQPEPPEQPKQPEPPKQPKQPKRTKPQEQPKQSEPQQDKKSANSQNSSNEFTSRNILNGELPFRTKQDLQSEFRAAKSEIKKNNNALNNILKKSNGKKKGIKGIKAKHKKFIQNNDGNVPKYASKQFKKRGKLNLGDTTTLNKTPKAKQTIYEAIEKYIEPPKLDITSGTQDAPPVAKATESQKSVAQEQQRIKSLTGDNNAVHANNELSSLNNALSSLNIVSRAEARGNAPLPPKRLVKQPLLSSLVNGKTTEGEKSLLLESSSTDYNSSNTNTTVVSTPSPNPNPSTGKNTKHEKTLKEIEKLTKESQNRKKDFELQKQKSRQTRAEIKRKHAEIKAGIERLRQLQIEKRKLLKEQSRPPSKSFLSFGKKRYQKSQAEITRELAYLNSQIKGKQQELDPLLQNSHTKAQSLLTTTTNTLRKTTTRVKAAKPPPTTSTKRGVIRRGAHRLYKPIDRKLTELGRAYKRRVADPLSNKMASVKRGIGKAASVIATPYTKTKFVLEQTLNDFKERQTRRKERQKARYATANKEYEKYEETRAAEKATQKAARRANRATKKAEQEKPYLENRAVYDAKHKAKMAQQAANSAAKLKLKEQEYIQNRTNKVIARGIKRIKAKSKSKKGAVIPVIKVNSRSGVGVDVGVDVDVGNGESSLNSSS